MFARLSGSKKFTWLFVSIVGIAGLLMFPAVTSYAHRAEGAEALSQVLNVLGDDNPEPDYCVKGGITDSKAIPLLSQAITSLEHAQTTSPADAQVLLMLGRAYCLAGEVEQAVEMYEAFTILRPTNPLGHLELGFAFEAAGLSEKMVIQWKKGGVRVEDFFQKGQELTRVGDYQRAILWYERANFLAPNMAQNWLQLGLAQVSLGNDDEAKKALETAWQLNGDLASIAYTTFILSKGDDRYGEEILRQVLRDYPNSKNRHELWKMLGEVLKQQGRWVEARQTYEAALVEFPEDIKFHIELGWTYYKSDYNEKGFDLALDVFKNAIKLNEKLGQGYFAIGQLMKEEGRYSEADSWLITAIAYNPQNRWWYAYRGNTARLAKNLSLAEEIFRETIERFPDYELAYFELAWVYYLNGNIKDAAQMIEYAIELSEVPASAFYLRAGIIYEAGNEYSKAIKAFEKALLTDPSNRLALENLQRIESTITIISPP